MLAENWGLQSRLEPQLAKPFDDEFLGIEVYRFAGFALPAVDTIKERQRILIKDENMEPPSTFWIVFRTLDEPMVMLVQRPAEAIAEVVEHPLLGSTSLAIAHQSGGWLLGCTGSVSLASISHTREVHRG